MPSPDSSLGNTRELWGGVDEDDDDDDDDEDEWRERKAAFKTPSLKSTSGRAWERVATQARERKQREEKKRTRKQLYTPLEYMGYDPESDIKIPTPLAIMVPFQTGRLQLVRLMPPSAHQGSQFTMDWEFLPGRIVTGFTRAQRLARGRNLVWERITDPDDDFIHSPMSTHYFSMYYDPMDRVTRKQYRELERANYNLLEAEVYRLNPTLLPRLKDIRSTSDDIDQFNWILDTMAYRLLEEDVGMRPRMFNWRQMIREVVNYFTAKTSNTRIIGPNERPSLANLNVWDLPAWEEDDSVRAVHDALYKGFAPDWSTHTFKAKKRSALDIAEDVQDVSIRNWLAQQQTQVPLTDQELADRGNAFADNDPNARANQLFPQTLYQAMQEEKKMRLKPVYYSFDFDEDEEPPTEDDELGSGLFGWVGNMGKRGLAMMMNRWRKKNCPPGTRMLMPGEYHYGCHNFTGPGTRMDLYSNAPTMGPIDECSRIHDVAYMNAAAITDQVARARAIQRADMEAIQCYNRTPQANGFLAAVSGIGGKFGAEQILSFLKGRPSVFYGTGE